MTLYAIPFTCSLAVRLALTERALPHHIRWMRRFEHIMLDDGARYAEINPKRRVPALALDDGELLTEIPAVLAYIDQIGTNRSEPERRRLLEWLCFIATELHRPALFLLFDPATPSATREDVLARLLPPVLDQLGKALEDRPALLGERASVADFYLLWALTLLRFQFKEHVPAGLEAYRRRTTEVPWIASVLAEERAAFTSIPR